MQLFHYFRSEVKGYNVHLNLRNHSPKGGGGGGKDGKSLTVRGLQGLTMWSTTQTVEHTHLVLRSTELPSKRIKAIRKLPTLLGCVV